MMKFSRTFLQKIEFGNAPSDIYYCLIDRQVSPHGLDIENMRLTDPRNIDDQFRRHGCLMMFTGAEINELVERGNLDEEKLHQSLYELAVDDGAIKPA